MSCRICGWENCNVKEEIVGVFCKGDFQSVPVALMSL